jgi:AraC-like DNA-binding protein
MTTSRRDRSNAVRQQAKDFTVRLGATIALIPVLESLGVNPTRLLTEAGADVSLFNSPDNWVSYRARNHWVAHCVKQTGCHHLGLLVGQRNTLQSLGLIGLLAKYSPDVESALRDLVRHFHLHLRGGGVTFSVEGRSAMLGFETWVPGAEANDQIEDAALASAFNFLRALCGPAWNATEVRFAHRKPADVRPYRAFFRAPLLFEDEVNAVVFPSSWLRHRSPQQEPGIRRFLERHVEALETQFGNDFPDQVRSVLRTALLTDRGSADQVAALFSMHSRTLHRRLAASGTNFRALVDECRFTIACQMLTDTRSDVSKIADMLNYADANSFTRAFRRWSGTTPATWRRQQPPV